MNIVVCSNCRTTTKDNDEKSCSICEGPIDHQLISGYWFDLAVEFDYEPTLDNAILIRDFYDIWNVDEYPTFREFMQAEVL